MIQFYMLAVCCTFLGGVSGPITEQFKEIGDYLHERKNTTGILMHNQ